MTSDDDAFDRDLTAILTAEPVDPAPLSQAVLTRLVTASAPERRGLAEVLVSPYPLAATLAGTLLLAGAASYAALPLLLGDDLSALVVLGNLLPSGGGF